MKKVFLMTFIFMVLYACDEGTRSSGSSVGYPLPSNFSELIFSLSHGQLAEATRGTININVADGQIAGTAVFFKESTTCSLILTFSSQQFTELNTKLDALKYCVKETNACVSGMAPSLTISSPSESLKIDRWWRCDTQPYLCEGADDLYLYLRTIIAANTNISTCPSDWASVVE
jgi:hypothetical protein